MKTASVEAGTTEYGAKKKAGYCQVDVDGSEVEARAVGSSSRASAGPGLQGAQLDCPLDVTSV